MDGKLLWIQSRKHFNIMVQVRTDSDMADINTKPLGGQRSRYLMNLIGYWRSEEQARVGENERKICEEKKFFVGKVGEIAKMIVRIVTFEGLQPMVTEGFIMRDKRSTNANWRWKTPIENAVVMIIIVGFAAMTFAMWTLYRYFEDRYSLLMQNLGDRVDAAELRMVDIEWKLDQVEGADKGIDKLLDYTRRIHSGLIPTGGFVDIYGMIGEVNAGTS